MENGPTAVHTKLGWVLCGPSVICSATPVTTSRVESQPTESMQLDEQLRVFWEL